MRINLKGLFWATSRLADGTRRTYWYAWRGGPRLRGEPGSPEFVASYNEAVATRITAPEGRLLALLQEYQRSTDFGGLRDRTRAQRFGDMPIKALADPRARGVFLRWRDELAVTSRRGADYCFVVLSLVLEWAVGRGRITVNPCARAGRIYHGTRVDSVWSIENEEAFLRSAPAHLHLPLLLALWTGQRQGDLLALSWSAYDGTAIRLRQSKTGAAVSIPAGEPLKLALDEAARTRRSPVILLNSQGRPWTSAAFGAAWIVARNKAGIVGVTFNDLRGTAVTRLALAGCNESRIAAITGHSLRDVSRILDAHYLHRDPELARDAIARLELAYARRLAETETRTDDIKTTVKMVPPF
jgi:integrase